MKKYLNIFAAGVFAASVAFAAPSAAETTIRLGLQSVPTDVLYQAKDWGEPYGLKTDVSTFSSAGDSLKAFVAGRIDVVSGGAARLVTMAAMQPETFLIVAANQYGGDRYGLMVGPDASYQTIEDLKGEKIGVVSGSGAHGTFMLYLQKNNLSPSDFQFVNMKVEDIAAAVNRGVVDAGLAWEPQVAIAEVNGAVKRLVSMKGISESPNFILASREYAKSNPDGLVRYIASLIDMSEFIRSNPEEVGELITAQLGQTGVSMDPKAMELAVSRTVVDPRIEDHLLDELPPIAESMISAGRIKSMPDFVALVDTSFYEQAVELEQAKK